MTRLLLITPDDVLAQAYRLRFQKAGYEIEREVNPNTGLLKARRWQPEIIVTDLLLPGISGLDVLKWLRDVPWLVKVPVVMLVERTVEPDMLAQCRRWGAAACLQKDQLSLHDVIARVREILPPAPVAEQPASAIASDHSNGRA